MNQALSHLHGRHLESAYRDDETEQWVFLFASGLSLQASCAWRIVADGRVVIGWRDDRQWFGLRAPIDAKKSITSLLGSSQVDSTAVSSFGDLTVRFGVGLSLELFNDSCGYEGWQLFGPGHRCVVAQGGGKVTDSAI